MCGQDHDLVCDLCHYDAHIQAQLPVTEELKELAMLADDDALSPHRDPFLKNLLEEERRRVGGGAEERKDKLRSFIKDRKSELQDVVGMWERFERHLLSLPYELRPANEPLRAIMFVEWKDKQEAELDAGKKNSSSWKLNLSTGSWSLAMPENVCYGCWRPSERGRSASPEGHSGKPVSSSS